MKYLSLKGININYDIVFFFISKIIIFFLNMINYKCKYYYKYKSTMTVDLLSIENLVS